VRHASPLVEAPARLLLLTDLHLHARSALSFRRLARAAGWARDFGVAAVLLGGDIVELDDEADVVAQRLRRLFGTLPLIAVLGNHETHEADWPLTLGIRAHVNDVGVIKEAFGRASIEIIDDRATTVAGLRVAGLAWRHGVGPTDAGRRLVGEGDPWPLVLTHSPDQLVGIDPGRIGLAFCGHTHGGQVRLPIIGTPITHTRTKLTRASGLTRVAGVETFISRGLGQTIPLRFASPPEAVLLELLPAPTA
jgi:predicted MPP superfamily phosphohydrolase